MLNAPVNQLRNISLHIKSFGLLGLRTLRLNEIMESSSLSPHDVPQLGVSRINIFVGPNGGGKSTVLDMVRALKNVDVIKTIARENMRSTTAATYIVHFDNGTYVGSILNKLKIDEYGVYLAVNTQHDKYVFEGSIYSKSSKPPKELVTVLNGLEAKINFRSSHDERGVSTRKIIDVLNNDGKHLVGLAPHPLQSDQIKYSGPTSEINAYKHSKPISLVDKEILGVFLNDDLGQQNHIPVKMLPSGWRAFAGLLGWLDSVDDDQICVIEEPEVHLHPTLQRLMVARISEIVARKNLQLFISTHSSVLLDISSWHTSDARLFEVNGYEISELTSPARALAGLGIKPSDVFQANGVIWVEGASDRIYILHWLSLWCSAHGEIMPIENVDFSFVFYGGSMLGHFTAQGSPGLIDIFSVNRNSIVVMDRDLDFQRDSDGADICINQRSVKYQVWADMTKNNSGSEYCWVTHDYTIESYLQPDFRNKYFEFVDSRISKTSSKSKVSIATEFVSEARSFDASFDPQTDLSIQIQKLFRLIKAWNL